MKRPQDEGPLSPAEGEALIARLACHAVRAADRCLLGQVVRWLFGRLVVGQEAKRRRKRRRPLRLGQSSIPPQEAVSEVVAGVGEAERGRL